MEASPRREQMWCGIREHRFLINETISVRLLANIGVIVMPEVVSHCAITRQHLKWAAHSGWKLPLQPCLPNYWPKHFHVWRSGFSYMCARASVPLNICIHVCSPWKCRPNAAFWISEKPRLLKTLFFFMKTHLNHGSSVCVPAGVCASVVLALVKRESTGWTG